MSDALIGATAAPNLVNAIVAIRVEVPRTIACVLKVVIARLIPVNARSTAASAAVMATRVSVVAPIEAASATVAAVPASVGVQKSITS